MLSVPYGLRTSSILLNRFAVLFVGDDALGIPYEAEKALQTDHLQRVVEGADPYRMINQLTVKP